LDTQLDPLVEQRIAKVRELREAGINPYPYRYDRTHLGSQVLEDFDALEGTEVRIAGRMLTSRIMGKASFAHNQDQSGRIQIYVRRDKVGEQQYDLFKSLDSGDFLGVSGKPFRTRTGEVTVEAEEMLVSLAEHLGARPRVHTSDPDVRVRLHTCEDSILVFAVNLSPYDKNVRLSFADGIDASQAVDLATGEPIEAGVGHAAIDLRGRDARVLQLPLSAVRANRDESVSQIER
jgi:hypothetical protein